MSHPISPVAIAHNDSELQTQARRILDAIYSTAQSAGFMNHLETFN